MFQKVLLILYRCCPCLKYYEKLKKWKKGRGNDTLNDNDWIIPQ